MAQDDWRIRIDVAEDERAGGLLDRLGRGLSGEAAELAAELEARRLAVSRDGNEIFVYAGSAQEAHQALAVIQAVVRDDNLDATTGQVEHWLADEERWDDEPNAETWEQEEVDRGYAPWEVRVDTGSRAAAHELADQLEQEGYSVERRFSFIIAGAASREDADALATRLHGEVEPGGQAVWETVPGNPFAVFGGMGGSGTPV